MKTDFAVLGIHTGVGKTVCSAVITQALGCDYWKPVQAGDLDNTDTMKVRSWVTNEHSTIHQEAFRLTQPMSPHAAAAIDGVSYSLHDFQLPSSSNGVLLETAGGVMSPLSNERTMVDLVAHLQLPAVLVVQHYLGSINHSLLCLEILKSRGIHLLGVIISGERNLASESFISSYAHASEMAFVPAMNEVNAANVALAAEGIFPTIKKWML